MERPLCIKSGKSIRTVIGGEVNLESENRPGNTEGKFLRSPLSETSASSGMFCAHAALFLQNLVENLHSLSPPTAHPGNIGPEKL